MQTLTLKYLAKTTRNLGFSGVDLQNKETVITINIIHIVSISEPEAKFESTDQKYALMTLSNNDLYYIREETYLDLVMEVANKNIRLPI